MHFPEASTTPSSCFLKLTKSEIEILLRASSSLEAGVAAEPAEAIRGDGVASFCNAEAADAFRGDGAEAFRGEGAAFRGEGAASFCDAEFAGAFRGDGSVSCLGVAGFTSGALFPLSPLFALSHLGRGTGSGLAKHPPRGEVFPMFKLGLRAEFAKACDLKAFG